MSSIETLAQYETIGAKPASTVKTDIVTCPANGSWYVLTGADVCASDGVAGTIDVLWYDGSVEYTILKAVPVPAAGNLDLEFRPTVLRAGQILRMTPSRASQHVVVTYMVGRPGQSNTASAGVAGR